MFRRESSGCDTVANEALLPTLYTRVQLRDVFVLTTVPAVLIFAFFLPTSLKWRLGLDYANPTVLTAFASHFVHISWTHLLINLIGYLLVVPTAYLLAVAGDRRRQFFVVYVTFILAFPLFLSGFNLLWDWPYLGLGFSGILMAFVGYLPLPILRFVGVRFSLPVDEKQSLWLFSTALAIAAIIALPGVYRLVFTSIALITTGLFGWQLITETSRANLSTVKNAMGIAGNVELVVLGSLVFFCYPFIAFSSDILINGNVLNVYTHGLGFCLGYAATYIGVLSGWLDSGG